MCENYYEELPCPRREAFWVRFYTHTALCARARARNGQMCGDALREFHEGPTDRATCNECAVRDEQTYDDAKYEVDLSELTEAEAQQHFAAWLWDYAVDQSLCKPLKEFPFDDDQEFTLNDAQEEIARQPPINDNPDDEEEELIAMDFYDMIDGPAPEGLVLKDDYPSQNGTGFYDPRTHKPWLPSSAYVHAAYTKVSPPPPLIT